MIQSGLKVGWLVNDCLTTIPKTKTFWHDLLEWIPGLEDKTGGYTKFDYLAEKIEKNAIKNGPPDYIIRNATFFRNINIKVKQIVLMQDCYNNGALKLSQLSVCNNADVVVFNSDFVCDAYSSFVHKPYHVIPIGVDFDFFTPSDDKKDYDIVYVGDSSQYPKGFNVVKELIKKTDYKFALVMKDGFRIKHKRVTVFNKIDHNALRYILRRSRLLLCTSKIETLHLAGIEAMACNIPVVATNVGIYKAFSSIGLWGFKVETEKCINFEQAIKVVFQKYNSYKPREFAFENSLDKSSCKRKWLNLIEEMIYNV